MIKVYILWIKSSKTVFGCTNPLLCGRNGSLLEMFHDLENANATWTLLGIEINKVMYSQHCILNLQFSQTNVKQGSKTHGRYCESEYRLYIETHLSKHCCKPAVVVLPSESTWNLDLVPQPEHCRYLVRRTCPQRRQSTVETKTEPATMATP